jgi:membrane protease YdiL (CAAX protease family)
MAQHRHSAGVISVMARPDTRFAVALVVALAVAALLPSLRPVLALALVAAYVASGRRGSRSEVLAASLPVAAILAWGAIGQPPAAPNAAQCTDLLSPPALWRAVEALVGLAVLGLLVVERRASLAELGLSVGSRRAALLAVTGALVVGPLALYASTWLGSATLGGSFFGTYELDLSRPAALLPAMAFAVSNAVAEELAYRGALMRWLTPSLGIVAANVGQAIVFGLAHAGADFVGPFLPTAAAMVLTGFLGGVIARRTGSLTLLIAVHAAADIPIYYFWACRVA